MYSVLELALAGEVDHALGQFVEAQEHLACAVGRAGDGVVHDDSAQLGVVLDEHVDAVDEATAAGHDYAVLGDVGHELRRGALEDVVDALEYLPGRFHEDLGQLRGAELDHLGQAGDEVAALDFLDADLRLWHDAAYVYLYLLGGLCADEDVVAPADVADDGVVEAAAGDLYGLALSHAAEGDDGRLRRAAADVYDEVTVRLGDVYARAIGRGDGALDEVDLPGAGLDHGVYDGALLDAGDAAGDADQDPGLEQAEARHSADELL